MEILAPAGNLETFYKAVQGGADAVYFGLKFFNARKPALNFSFEDYREAYFFAKENKIRIYLTLNIDIKEAELILLVKVLEKLKNIPPNALIVKDLGLIYLLRKFYPNFEIHLSTQFGISNHLALKEALKMGVTRVVLSRELNFEELKRISKEKDIPELEVFGHGSMCFSFSGKCLLSSWIGGRSANRGMCLAPCRLKYQTKADQKSSFFSMKDLSLLEDLEKLERLGISSLKIEGRLKSASYVYEVCKLYKQALVGDSAKVNPQILKKFSGREISKGFLYGSQKEDLISQDTSKTGVYLGKIKQEGNRYFLEKDNFPQSSIVKVLPQKIIFYPENLHREKGKLFLDKKVDLDLTGSAAYELFMANEKKEVISDKAVHLKLSFADNTIGVEIKTNTDRRKFEISNKKIVKEKRAVSITTIVDKLENKFYYGWLVEKITIENDFLIAKSFVKNVISEISKAINQLKKSFMLEDITLPREIKACLENIEACTKGRNSLINSIVISQNQLTEIAQNLSLFKEIKFINLRIEDFKNLKNLAKFRQIITHDFKKKMILSFPYVFFEDDINEFQKYASELDFSNLIIEVNDLGLVNFFKDKKVDLVAGSFFNSFNSLGINFLKELGFKKNHLPLEFDYENLDKICLKSPLPLRFLYYGRIPLFLTRVKNLSSDEYKDNLNNFFYLQKSSNLYYFLSDKPFLGAKIIEKDFNISEVIVDLSLEKDPVATFLKISQNQFEENEYSTFNYGKKLK